MLWNIDLWREMDRMKREMDTMFSNFTRTTGVATYPLINAYENKDTITINAELPGLTKDKVSITYSDGALTLKGKLEQSETVKNMNPVRRERSTGDFEKTIRIPMKIDQEKIGASFSNGILTITLPKSEEAKPKSITIEA